MLTPGDVPLRGMAGMLPPPPSLGPPLLWLRYPIVGIPTRVRLASGILVDQIVA